MSPNDLLLARADLSHAAGMFATAEQCSRAWHGIVDAAIAMYGDHGALISGVYRDHYPSHVKDMLRGFARAESEARAHAFRLKPKRVRLTTMRALMYAVREREQRLHGTVTKYEGRM